jgi:outer membrane protein assembly factor BamA
MEEQASAQTSDEEGLRLRRQRMPKKNLAQQIIAVPTMVMKFPLFLTGRGIKHTAIFISDISLIPRTRALLTRDDELVALYPAASLGGRSGLAAELNFFNKRFLKKGNKLSLQASYSTNRHQDSYISYQIPEMLSAYAGTSLFLDMRGGYEVKTNEDFFGIGNESNRDDRTNFRHEQLGGELTVGVAWTKSLRTRLLIDYTDHAIEHGDGTYDSTLDRFDPQTTPGLDGATLLGVGGSVAFDTRDSHFYPSRGGLAEFSVTLFDQVDANNYGFTRYDLELGHYLTLFRPWRILAIRLLGEINTRLSSSRPLNFASATNRTQRPETPFFERASLGGATSLRGYSTGRFRDKDLILLNVEYRYSIWDKELEGYGALDTGLFIDIGRVFDDLTEDTFRDYQISYGVGIRARTKENLLFRAEIAWSSEETNLIFKFEPIF